VVECLLAKEDVASSSLVSRSIFATFYVLSVLPGALAFFRTVFGFFLPPAVRVLGLAGFSGRLWRLI
jgi:hypothetical protein